MLIVDILNTQYLTELFHKRDFDSFKRYCSPNICINIEVFNKSASQEVKPYILEILYHQENNCYLPYIEYLLEHNYQAELLEYAKYLENKEYIIREVISPKGIIEKMSKNNNADFLHYLINKNPSIFSFAFRGIGSQEELLFIELVNFKKGLEVFESKYGNIHYYLIDALINKKIDIPQTFKNYDVRLLETIVSSYQGETPINHKKDKISQILYRQYMLEYSLEKKLQEKVVKI